MFIESFWNFEFLIFEYQISISLTADLIQVKVMHVTLEYNIFALAT